MRTWPALLGTPSIVLVTLTVNYALVPQACASGNGAPMGTFSMLALAFSIAATIVAWRRWREMRLFASAEDAALPARAGFVACVATLTGATSTLALLAMWIPQWVIPACVR